MVPRIVWSFKNTALIFIEISFIQYFTIFSCKQYDIITKSNLHNRKTSIWQGITLLVIASKVLGKILIKRLKNGADKRLRAEQAGFRQGRSTTEQIFILHNIIEQTMAAY